jgi:hypothetical protein
MSLQGSSNSLASLANPQISAIQNYNFTPSGSRLDSITEQILKTEDAALEVMKLIENGSVKRMWVEQKKLPSATWLGDRVDWLLGWGQYHPESEKKALTSAEPKPKRALLDYRCPNTNDTNSEIVRDYLNTSYEVQTYPNGSCSQLDPVVYWTEIFQIIFRPVSADDVICRIADCMRTRLQACYPTCLPCLNATDMEKNITVNTTQVLLWFKSDFDEDQSWVYLIQTSYRDNYPNLNAWKLDQILTLFNSTRKDCQNQVLHPPANSDLNALYSLLIIPVALAGGVIYVVYKRKQANPAYDSLESPA